MLRKTGFGLAVLFLTAVGSSEPLSTPTRMASKSTASTPPIKEEKAHKIVKSTQGEASWYGKEFAGSRTASGEVFRPRKLTAAHRDLPFDTKVRVTNLENGRSVIVRINDRGPHTPERLIDISQGAAKKLDMVTAGTALVRVEVLSNPL